MLLWTILNLIALWALTRKHTTIVNENGPYLTRYYLAPWLRYWFGCNLFLHHFHQSDNREYHSHPWKDSASLILWGGYVEHRLEFSRAPQAGDAVDDLGTCQVLRRTLRPGSVNRLASTTFHYVTLLQGSCWSLFWAGEQHGNDWGFLTEDGQYELARVRLAGKDTLSTD